MTIRFRRNTHDLAGNYRKECDHIKAIPPGEIDPMHWEHVIVEVVYAKKEQ
jgi:hypothetical protein